MSDSTIYTGDCRDVLAMFYADNHFDSIVTDPPYGLEFMGKEWDKGVPGVEFWREAFRVLKPGGHLLAFSGTRTYHRMVCAIEDAGFEIRDQIGWVYGSGFPKSLDVSKAIDKAAGAEREVIGVTNRDTGPSQKRGYQGTSTFRESESNPGNLLTAPATDAAKQWQGWGTALKPAWEPIAVARKPLIGTVAANVLAHGTGALNIDACRIETSDNLNGGAYSGGLKDLGAASSYATGVNAGEFVQPTGRWPANLIHDGSDEVLAAFPQAPGQLADESHTAPSAKTGNIYGAMKRQGEPSQDSENEGAVGFKMKPGARRLDAGSAARFFYCAKASKKDRGEGNTHPTVKPTELMRYLCRLITPPRGVVLDLFVGSGSTGKAAVLEGFDFVGIDLEPNYVAIAEARIAAA